MDKVKAMHTFVRIVEANSFSKAAEILQLPRASLTATIQNLEAYLGTQLLQRTTRRLSVTPDGAQYYQQCLEILGAIEASEMAFRSADAARPRGKLRVELPGALGRHLVIPRLAEFHRRCPDVELAVSTSDRLVDLTQEGIDCALRVGQLADSSLVARRMGTMRFVACAAPAYLAAHGAPQSPDTLDGHVGVVHFSGRTGRPFEWEWQAGTRSGKFSLPGPVAVSDADANLSCAVQGLGLAQLATYQARPHLADGSLLPVLTAVQLTEMPVSLLYPKGRMATPKLGAFATWLAGLFENDPDLRLVTG
ncbi:LysR family transcriptional regulator [Massilia sp. CF038]|uniref:LysR substrate-binding domain-containing protein n=1 Tax=Massilia sp. CF038 TaxID=1881045 RepID=UPI00090FA8A6|nr:LysR family transcriptional regulator [Massilia sp. CF038]SHG64380.1 LysR family transcriptional regulator, regulator for bpeEF and oprC [Massilia sp. CF038]